MCHVSGNSHSPAQNLAVFYQSRPERPLFADRRKHFKHRSVFRAIGLRVDSHQAQILLCIRQALLRKFLPAPPHTLAEWRRRFLSHATSERHAVRTSFLIGLANGLMPCGPLQSMQVYALGTGSALNGACSMAVFCLGTMPAMLALGLASGRMNKKGSGIILQASAAVVIALGLGMMGSGLALTGHSVSAPAFLSTPAPLPENAAVAKLDGGGQDVASLAGFGAYQPIVVQKGIPVSWNLKMPEDTLIGCNNEIIASDFGIRQKLKEGDNIMRFTPAKTGRYVFSCWMGMIKSSITVVDRLPE